MTCHPTPAAPIALLLAEEETGRVIELHAVYLAICTATVRLDHDNQQAEVRLE